jgi:hypothetical protein
LSGACASLPAHWTFIGFKHSKQKFGFHKAYSTRSLKVHLSIFVIVIFFYSCVITGIILKSYATNKHVINLSNTVLSGVKEYMGAFDAGLLGWPVPPAAAARV